MSEKTAAQRCRTVVELLRLGAEAQAHTELAALMDALLPYIQRHAQLFGPDEVALINQMVEAQARSDYLLLADLLEYELPGSRLGGFVSDV